VAREIDGIVVQNAFVVSTFDSYVYSTLVGSNCVIICLCNDNMLIFGTNIHVVNETMDSKCSQFVIKRPLQKYF